MAGSMSRSPARIIPLTYLGTTVAGTALLLLPASTAPGEHTDLISAAFHAVSALCITGLSTVDTGTHWTMFGQGVLMLLIQLGGLGIVTLATMLALVVTGKVGLSGTLVASNELHVEKIGDVWRLPRRIAIAMLSTEAVLALLLTLRFQHYFHDWPKAVWYGSFHAVSAFNNAGFALFSDSLSGFITDPWLTMPICAAIVLGGLGFPVFFELTRRGRLRRPGHWSIHTRMTVWGTVTLLTVGIALFALFEWNNPATLGPLPASGKLLGALGGGVFPRTAGFNSIDYAAASEQTIALNYLLMFIGGGSAGTAGGIKVGTFVILFAAIRAEIVGEPQTVMAHRGIPFETIRQALTVVLLGFAAVSVAAALVLFDTRFTLSEVLFECISAFGTVGLSLGITADLPAESLVILMTLMFLGRVGTISVAAALSLNQRHRRYRLPEERPIVG
ncbi:MAG: TrkH family potassium uptake protein [Propioniciclava sp.]